MNAMRPDFKIVFFLNKLVASKPDQINMQQANTNQFGCAN